MWLPRGCTSRHNNQKKRLYEGTFDPKLPKYIRISDIFGSGKIQPDVVQSPGSPRKNVAERQRCRPLMPVQVEPVEALRLLLTAHMAVYLMLVMVVVLLSTVTSTSSGKKRTRKYTQRKPKEDPAAPPCPDCPYGYGRKKRSGDKYKATCSTCYADKKNGRTSRQSSSASEEDGAAESSQRASASTLRQSSGGIVSPRSTHAGRPPRAHTWNGSQYQADDPTAPQNVARRTHARGGRGFSTLQAGWKMDFPWMHCEKDTELMAATGGRCVTELSAADCEECVGCHLCSRMYCKNCRSRTGNAFSADVGCRTFKRDELARHERIFHPKKLGSGNVETMLSNEAARVKQTRIRTILAVVFLAVEKIALLKLPALAKLIYEMGFKTADMVHDHLGLKYMGKDAARDFLFCVAVILREWINVQARNSPVLGIMVDESTDVSQKKVPQTDAPAAHESTRMRRCHFFTFGCSVPTSSSAPRDMGAY